MNFKKMSIFHRGGAEDDYEQEAQSSGGVLAVWGSPGSGKTVTAVKLAKALADKKRNVALVLCDMTAPMLPCICPGSELECERSLGTILAAARIGESLIKHNCVTHKRLGYLTILGMQKGENEYTYPPYTEKQATELLDGLREIVPYVVIDCGSYIANDILPTATLNLSATSPASSPCWGTPNGMRISSTRWRQTSNPSRPPSISAKCWAAWRSSCRIRQSWRNSISPETSSLT